MVVIWKEWPQSLQKKAIGKSQSEWWKKKSAGCSLTKSSGCQQQFHIAIVSSGNGKLQSNKLSNNAIKEDNLASYIDGSW